MAWVGGSSAPWVWSVRSREALAMLSCSSSTTTSALATAGWVVGGPIPVMMLRLEMLPFLGSETEWLGAVGAFPNRLIAKEGKDLVVMNSQGGLHWVGEVAGAGSGVPSRTEVPGGVKTNTMVEAAS